MGMKMEADNHEARRARAIKCIEQSIEPNRPGC